MRPESSAPALLVIESGLTFLLLLAALAVRGPSGRRTGWRPAFWARLARRKSMAVLLTGALALLGRLALLPLLPIPQPFFHDEFSYLLAANTYASGRLTNPTHPLWPFFESFHIDQIPTYMSMYFPGQGLLLAAGKVTLGHPWWGVAISTALLCAALCWMLQGWLPPQWALLGGCIAVVRLALFSYWANSYWGGSLPALGGALILGSLPRIRRRPEILPGLAMSAGFLILGLTRPYEGLLVSVPVAAALLLPATKPWRPGMWKFVWTPIAVTSILMLCGMLYYNQRVFLHALTFPYQTNYREYVAARQFVWQSRHATPVYRHKAMQDFYMKQLAQSDESLSFSGWAGRTLVNGAIGVAFFFGILFVIPLFWIGFAIRDRRIRFVVWASGAFVGGLMLNNWLLPHYASPATGLAYIILIQCMRHMAQRKTGLFLLRGMGLCCAVVFLLRLAAQPLGIRTEHDPTTWYGTTSQPGLPRAEVLARLERLPGRHLVIVRYSPAHDPVDEWVYNAPDIDRSSVVWARDMGGEDGKLLQYFSDRDVWIAEPDYSPPRLTRFVP